GQAELATDDIVARARVAKHVDALDIDARPLVGHVGHIDEVSRWIPRCPGPNAGKGDALLGQGKRESLHGLFHQGLVEGRPRGGKQLPAQVAGIDPGEHRFHLDGAELEELALVDDEGDVETRAVAIELGARGDDANVGVAALQVELAHELLIQGHPVRVVDVGALDEVEQAGLGGGNDVAQLAVAEGAVADEVDGLHLGRRPLVDLKHDVDAVVVELDDLGVNGSRIPALPAVDVEDSLHIGLGAGAREHRARLELNLGGESLLVDLAIALEYDLIDHRVLDHRDEDACAVALDAYVREQAGGKQRFDRLI